MSPHGVPWERRADIGFATGLLETIRESLLHPTAFFRKVDPASPVMPALFYAILVTGFGITFALLWDAILPGPWMGMTGRLGGDAGERVVGIVVLWLFLPLLIPLGLVVGAAIYHVVLLALGGPSRGFGGTLRALSYASAPQLFSAIPLCGGLLSFGWGLVLQVVGLREVHGLQTGKAVAVVVIPVLLCVILILVFVGAFLAMLLSSGGFSDG